MGDKGCQPFKTTELLYLFYLNSAVDLIIGPVGSEVIITFLQACEISLVRQPLPETKKE